MRAAGRTAARALAASGMMLALGAAVGPAAARTRAEEPTGGAAKANGGRVPRAAAGLSFASVWAVAAAAADPLAPAAAELKAAASLPAAAAAGDAPSPSPHAAASSAPSSAAPEAAGKGAVSATPAAGAAGGGGAAHAGPSSAKEAHAHGGGGSGAAKKAALAPEKPCRACTDAQDLFAAFAKFEQRQAAAGGAGAGSGGGMLSAAAAHGATAGGKQAPAPPAPPALVAANADPGAPFWGPGERAMPCPPDAGALGRATWAFLHATAAYLPDAPTPAQSAAAAALLRAVAELYPCGYCADHLRAYMARHPPDTTSGPALAAWLCAKHNEVNARLGKPAFDCGALGARWRDGPADGEPECDERAGRL